jgi:hypothetical protein
MAETIASAASAKAPDNPVVDQESTKNISCVTRNSRSISTGCDCPLYSKQFCDMEFTRVSGRGTDTGFQ